MLDTVAATTAAPTLPCAIEVNAIDDCTVDGSAQTKRRPSQSAFGTACGSAARISSPSKGNRPKVAARITRWRRQWAAPVISEARERRAPWRKNISAIATVVRSENTVRAVPEQGKRLASPTAPRSDRMNGSILRVRSMNGSLH